MHEIGQRTRGDNSFFSGGIWGYSDSWSWGYDGLGQVVSANYGTNSTHDRYYAYDKMGNRTQSRTGTYQSSGGSQTTYGRNGLNQYSQINPPAVAAMQPGYDTDGNMTAGPLPVQPTQLNELQWDGRNQLLKAHSGTGAGKSLLATYTYDALGRRAAKTIGGVRDYYFYDDWNVVAEYRGNVHTGGTAPGVTLRRTFSWGLDLSGTFQGAGGVGGLLAMKNTDGSIYYPTYDANGNVMSYLDESGEHEVQMNYDPFGNIVSGNGTHADFPHKFSTKYTDNETGLLYYGYRYLDPLTGRWPSRDPIGESGGVNIYGFVGNRTINEWDLLGQRPCNPTQISTCKTKCKKAFKKYLNCAQFGNARIGCFFCKCSDERCFFSK